MKQKSNDHLKTSGVNAFLFSGVLVNEFKRIQQVTDAFDCSGN